MITPIQNSTTPTTPPIMTIFPMQEDVRENVVTFQRIEVSGKVFSDQTERFSIASNKGKNTSWLCMTTIPTQY